MSSAITMADKVMVALNQFTSWLPCRFRKTLDKLVKLLIGRFTTCANQVPCALVPYVSVASLSNVNRKYRNLDEFLRACFKLRKDTIS